MELLTFSGDLSLDHNRFTGQTITIENCMENVVMEFSMVVLTLRSHTNLPLLVLPIFVSWLWSE